MTREQMIDVIIQRLGLEHKATIWFVQFCEDHPTASDMKLYKVFFELLRLVRMVERIERV